MGFQKILSRLIKIVLDYPKTSIIFFILAVIFVYEFRKNQPLLDPFEISENIDEFSGKTIAELTIDRINLKFSSDPESISASSGGGDGDQEGQVKERLGLGGVQGTTIKTEIGGISLDSFIAYFKNIIGKETEIITGNVIRKGDNIQVIVRSNKKGRTWSDEGNIKDLNLIIDNLAERIAISLAPDYMKPEDLAMFYYGIGEYEKAEELYKAKIIKENSNHPESYVEWANTLIRMWDDEKALKTFQLVYEVACKNSSAEKTNNLFQSIKSMNRTNCINILVNWGIGLSIMGSKDDAISKYKEAKEIESENPRIYSQWGYELYLMGKKEEGNENIEKAREKYDESIDFFENHSHICETPVDTDTPRKPTLKNKEFHRNCADFYNNWGLVLDGNKKYLEAIDKYEKASVMDPEFYYAFYNWGLDLYTLGKQHDTEYKQSRDKTDKTKFTEATKAYRLSISKYKKSLNINPNYRNAYYNLGLTHGALGNHKEAIKHYKQAVEIDPKDTQAYNNMGLSYEAMGRYNDAIEKYQRALDIDPKYILAYNNLGISYAAIGKYDEAIRQYAKAVEIDPKYHLAHYYWASSLQEVGKHPEAIEKYKNTIELAPDYYLAYYGWAISLGKLSEYPEAIKKYEETINLNRGYLLAYEGLVDSMESVLESKQKPVGYEITKKELSKAYDNWGIALYDSGQLDEAEEKHRKAAELDPNNYFAFYNWGLTLMTLREYPEAVEKYEAVIQLDPENYQAFHGWGFSLARLGNHTKAIEKYTRATELNADNYILYYDWGLSLEILGEYLGAVEKYREVVNLKPDYLPAYEGLVISLETLITQKGKGEEVNHIKKELSEAYGSWGKALDNLGKHEEAMEKYNKAKTIRNSVT